MVTGHRRNSKERRENDVGEPDAMFQHNTKPLMIQLLMGFQQFGLR